MSVNINRAALPLAVCTALLVSACGESTSSNSGPDFGGNPTPDTSFNQQALIENLVDNVITPTFEQFSVLSAANVQALNNYCQQETAAVEGNSTAEQVTTAKNSAQGSWRDTMNVWQQAEVMKVGPLAENSGLLRDKIYSWPVVNTCSVDFEVVNFRAGEVNGQVYNIANRTPSRRGLAALEYLLFNENLNHSCTTSTQPDNWDNQTDDYRKVARCEFAVEVAQDIDNSAQELLTAWNGSDGFASTIKQAGGAGNQFTTELEALNRISDALFYLDNFTKDGKLSTPLGLLANTCGSQACPEAVESLFAHHSVANIENNLLAFQKLLTGGTGIGFTDYLIDEGDETTASMMTADVQQAIVGVQGFQETLGEALINNEAQVTQTHADIKAVTDKLKVDFITSLSLQLPATSAGDND
jgi:predicted lipoprotein